MEERAARVADFVRSLLGPPGGLEVFIPPPPREQQMKHYLEASGAPEERVSIAVDGLRAALDNEVPTAEQLEAIEAIVLPDLRPVIEIANDGIPRPPRGTWKRLETDAAWLGDFLRAVGRLDCEALHEPCAGSALLVADDLALTNRHVALLFARGLGTKDALSQIYAAELDYRGEKSAPDARSAVEVEDVVLIHPYWDVAVLRVKKSADRKPVTLASEAPENPGECPVAVIGYPFFRRARSEYERKVLRGSFGDTPGYKHLQPGRLVDRIEFKPALDAFPAVLALGHDASTLGSNSGSLVVDLDTRRVLAIHFASEAFLINWAVPTWELYRDPRLRDLGINFEKLEPPSPDPEVEEAWSALAPKIVSVPAPAPDAPETSPEPEDLAPVSPILAPADGIATTRLDLALEVTVRVLAPEIRGAISPPPPPRLR
jgi:endonuclease G